jgi:hypothetical protein
MLGHTVTAILERSKKGVIVEYDNGDGALIQEAFDELIMACGTGH